MEVLELIASRNKYPCDYVIFLVRLINVTIT